MSVPKHWIIIGVQSNCTVSGCCVSKWDHHIRESLMIVFLCAVIPFISKTIIIRDKLTKSDEL